MGVNDWIKDLKPGDQVAVYSARHYSISFTVRTVEKVTPTGRVNLNNGRTYNPDGWERGPSAGYRSHIAQLTPKLQEEHKRRVLENKIGAVRLEDLTTEQLQAVAEALGVL